MKVSVVIPNWNGREVIAACLDSVFKQSLKDTEVIVVDNGSTDGSVELIEKNYPAVRLIKREKNYGFTGGVNPGIEASTAEYVALLNDDAVADPQWLKELVVSLDKNPEVAFASAKIVKMKKNDDQTIIDTTGEGLSIWGWPFARGRGEADKGQYDALANIFAVSGGASMYRRSIFSEIGLFDQRFFAYYEDVDLCFRGQMRGHKAIFVPSAVVYHHVGYTSGGDENRPSPFTRYHGAKNLFMLYFKNMPGWLFWKYLPRFIFSLSLNFLASVKHGMISSWIKALGTIIIFFPGLCLDRWKIQRQRSVPVGYIDSMLWHELPPLQKRTFGKIFAKVSRGHS